MLLFLFGTSTLGASLNRFLGAALLAAVLASFVLLVLVVLLVWSRFEGKSNRPDFFEPVLFLPCSVIISTPYNLQYTEASTGDKLQPLHAIILA
ncbi:MAG: hypothetical protein LBJ00_12540 [Planctomycetaceae bacterium]|nr:hypothetical protein [Planctomycetaceae bacterium]